MKIAHQGTREEGRFTAFDGAAELTYRKREEGIVVFDHTFVPPEHRGRGIAAELVAAGVAWARDEGLRVVPQCPYVATLFRRDPQTYADVAAG